MVAVSTIGAMHPRSPLGDAETQVIEVDTQDTQVINMAGGGSPPKEGAPDTTGEEPPPKRRRKRWKRTGYFGHTPVETFRLSMRRGDNVPIHGPQIVLLDTGAALSANGRLSAVCAESGELVQMDRVGELVETA